MIVLPTVLLDKDALRTGKRVSADRHQTRAANKPRGTRRVNGHRVGNGIFCALGAAWRYRILGRKVLKPSFRGKRKASNPE
jgi:hypothetical protein